MMSFSDEFEEWKRKVRPKHRAILFALCICCTKKMDDRRVLLRHKHVSPQAVSSKLKREHRRKVKTGLDALCAKGLTRRHPTRGGMTYHLTSLGLYVAELFERKN